MKFVLKVFMLISLIVVSKLTRDQQHQARTSTRKPTADTQVFSQHFEPGDYAPVLPVPAVSAFEKGSLQLN